MDKPYRAIWVLLSGSLRRGFSFLGHGVLFVFGSRGCVRVFRVFAGTRFILAA
jgi:hypothetical protein